jgi:hypothetical protein
MIQYRKTWQNTARIARAIGNAAVCRTFLQSVFTVLITPLGALSPASNRQRARVQRARLAVLRLFLGFNVSAVGAGCVFAT